MVILKHFNLVLRHVLQQHIQLPEQNIPPSVIATTSSIMEVPRPPTKQTAICHALAIRQKIAVLGIDSACTLLGLLRSTLLQVPKPPIFPQDGRTPDVSRIMSTLKKIPTFSYLPSRTRSGTTQPATLLISVLLVAHNLATRRQAWSMDRNAVSH